MKIPSSNSLLPLLISVLALAGSARAANINWSTPTTVSGATNVTTTGTLVEAVNTGADQNSVGATTTINGVTFTGWPVTGGGTPVSPSGHFTFAAASGYFHQSFNGFGSGATPFASLPVSYQTLLGWGNYSQSQTNPNDFTGALTLTISGLAIGNLYIFQWWTNDSRSFANGPVIATTGATSVGLLPNTTNSPGGVGQFAVGTFTADAITQSIVFSTAGNGVLISGFQLRVVPEPSTLALLGTGVLLAGIVVRLRR